jgi:hypothetical protein
VKPQTTATADPQKCGLDSDQIVDLCQTTPGENAWNLPWLLNLVTFGQPDDAKRGAVLVATPDEIEIPNFENLQL